MVAHFYLARNRNNVVAVYGRNRNVVAVSRNHHVVAGCFDMAVIKML
jgi:hypothetical protein